MTSSTQQPSVAEDNQGEDLQQNTVESSNDTIMEDAKSHTPHTAMPPDW
jgi:hypothetical protein